MHQDIQSFSDLTGIDTSALLTVQVVLVNHGGVDFVFSVNDNEFSGTTFVKQYPIDTELEFKCQLVEFVENSGGIEIKSITVNNKEVLPLYQHRASPATAYIDFSDSWEFRISGLFYPWYHEITGQGWIA
jgi:hypothetical protein